MADNNNLKIVLEQALNALEWYEDAHPEDGSPADDEFKEICREVIACAP